MFAHDPLTRRDESDDEEEIHAQGQEQLLFVDERFEPSILMLSNKDRKVVQWRMRERVRVHNSR